MFLLAFSKNTSELKHAVGLDLHIIIATDPKLIYTSDTLGDYNVLALPGPGGRRVATPEVSEFSLGC